MHDKVSHRINTIAEILPTFAYWGITDTQLHTPGMCICTSLQLFDLLMCPQGNNWNGSIHSKVLPKYQKKHGRWIEAFLYIYTKG